MTKSSKYVGLDTHKDVIAVAVADAGQSKPRYYRRLSRELSPELFTPPRVVSLRRQCWPDGREGFL